MREGRSPGMARHRQGASPKRAKGEDGSTNEGPYQDRPLLCPFRQ